MGPYCKFCDRRCFVLRTLKDGRSMLLATCPSGMEYDRAHCGEDHTTAINPRTAATRTSQAPGRAPGSEYDDDLLCLGCGEQFAWPHAPACPFDGDNLVDVAHRVRQATVESVSPYAVAKLDIGPTRTTLTIRTAGHGGRLVLNVLATPATARDTSVGLMLRHAGLIPVGEWRHGSGPYEWAVDAAPHPQRCPACLDGCGCMAGTPGCGHARCLGTPNPGTPGCGFAELVAWLPTSGPTGVYA